MRIKNNSFISVLNGKSITIPAQHVFVKEYVEYSDKYHTEYACAYSKKDNYYIGCYHTDLKPHGYQEYLVPKGYSLSHNKTNNIGLKSVMLSHLTVDKIYFTSHEKPNNEKININVNTDRNYCKNFRQWTEKNKLKMSLFENTYSISLNRTDFLCYIDQNTIILFND